MFIIQQWSNGDWTNHNFPLEFPHDRCKVLFNHNYSNGTPAFICHEAMTEYYINYGIDRLKQWLCMRYTFDGGFSSVPNNNYDQITENTSTTISMKRIFVYPGYNPWGFTLTWVTLGW